MTATASPALRTEARLRGRLSVVADYVSLTKPRIIELLLVTTVPTMMLAARGWPGLGLVAATVVGGTLAAGGANVLNCYFDRDIDAVMRRTQRRPLATASISPRAALIFGVTLGTGSLLLLGFTTDWLASGLTAAAILLYVVGYTLGLKRHTPSNIVWGGAAGCMPVLIGWAAVTDTVGWPAVVLFLVIFFWTPPHFWALAIRFRADYAAAGVPMLPVVASDAVVTRRIVGYSWAMVGVSLLLWPVASTTLLYPVVAAVLGIGFLREAHRLARGVRRGGAVAKLKPMRLFHHSTTYLALLFAVVAIDALLL